MAVHNYILSELQLKPDVSTHMEKCDSHTGANVSVSARVLKVSLLPDTRTMQ